MIETPFYFASGRHQLFAMEHRPSSPGSSVGFVFCHPFAEEKLWSHRVMLNLARDLANSGFPALRFDQMGNGDSDGEFRDSSIETAIADTREAISQFKKRNPSVKRIGLVGVRLGAAIAMLLIEKKEPVDLLVLWEPVLDGEVYGNDLIRFNILTQMAVYQKVRWPKDEMMSRLKEGACLLVEGYEVGSKMFQQLTELSSTNSYPTFEGPVLCGQIKKKGRSRDRVLSEINSLMPNITQVSVDAPLFWCEVPAFCDKSLELTKETLSWIDRHG